MCGNGDELSVDGDVVSTGDPSPVPSSKPPVPAASVDTNANHDKGKSSDGPVDVNADSDKPKEKDPHKEEDPQVVEGGGQGDDDQHHDGDQIQEPVVVLSRRERATLIKKKLVTEHSRKKKTSGDDLLDEAHFAEGKKESSAAKAADTFGNIAGFVGLTAGGIGSAAAFGGDDDKAKATSAIAGLTANSIGFLTSGIKAGTGMYRASRTKSRYARSIANTKVSSGAVGMMGTAAGAGANVLSLYHDPEGTKAYNDGTKAQGAFNIFKGAMDAISGGLDFHASRLEKKAHGEISGKAATIAAGGSIRPDNGNRTRSLGQELVDTRNSIAGQKDERNRNPSAYNRVAMKEARQRRHTLKARKYAMKQAADMHSAREGESTKNVGSLVGGLFGGLGSILSGISSILGSGSNTGNILKYIGAGSSLIGALSKGIGKAVDMKKASNEKEALKPKKRDVVDEYISEKAGRIMEDARAVVLSQDEELEYGVKKLPELTPDEAKKIAVLRLFKQGADQSAAADADDDDNLGGALTPDDYEKAFKILTEKRANNILKSSPDDRNEMLDALGLSHDATLEDVKNALSGDIS